MVKLMTIAVRRSEANDSQIEALKEDLKQAKVPIPPCLRLHPVLRRYPCRGGCRGGKSDDAHGILAGPLRGMAFLSG